MSSLNGAPDKRPLDSSDSESTTATDNDMPIAHPVGPQAKVARTVVQPMAGLDHPLQPMGEQQFYQSGGAPRRCRAACMCCWERKLRCSMLKCGACLNCVERNRVCIPRIHNRRPSQLAGGRRQLGPEVLMTVEALTSMGAGSPLSMPQPVPAHGGMMFAPHGMMPGAPGMFYGGGYAPPSVVGIPVARPAVVSAAAPRAATLQAQAVPLDGANSTSLGGNGPMMTAPNGMAMANGVGAPMINGQMTNGTAPIPLAPGQVPFNPMNMYQFFPPPPAFHEMMMRQGNNPSMPGQMMQGYAPQPFAPRASATPIAPASAQHAQMMPQIQPHMLMQPMMGMAAHKFQNPGLMRAYA